MHFEVLDSDIQKKNITMDKWFKTGISFLWVKFIGGITSIYQPTNAHIISHKTLLKQFKTLRHVSILSNHRQGAFFLAKVMLQYSQFNWIVNTVT